ncbi:ZYBA0S04-10946g1_1 [Zygosaccharomyces bailii CLIB 213]|uniref:ZYBA0S04-10946g1_1 n=1 Tax=Zygosaccharomyces bailii (strain CLIB 213 / ATCC 58445 / CBS 680 / BCRC 21525 / NBRC 1098 / NCYC 1416 / NRRL Y-2227) TaxID=1333698 RepID=A0A8J2T984_ZYGB2|nr:ZYBA0S04-10946g1_1 [Zygosaccharomyces bailii CLIB 213]
MVATKYNYKSSAGHEENEKRALRSCVRCRKNKTKCDSMERRPNPCTSCMRKGVECHLDYVTPPQRSKEMKSLYESIRFASDKISTLCMVYDDFMKKFHLNHMRGTRRGIDCNKFPTRILKVKEQFFSFNLNPVDGSLYLNNFRIRSDFLKQSFANFRQIVNSLIKIYFKWERIEGSSMDKVEIFVSQLNPNYLLQTNQLLLLLCILNFYYDIPGLKYLNIFEYIIESYYVGASENSDVIENSKFFTRSNLAKLVAGNLPNGQFHGEVFIKHFTIFLFLNIILYGPEYFMGCFMDKYIRTLEFLRKKINFDKNWEVKWINFYIRLLNLVEAVCPFVGGSKYAVEEEEIDFLFSLVNKEREVDSESNITLDCFICLVKFDQYLIERRRWPRNEKVCKSFAYICRRLTDDLYEILRIRSDESEQGERLSFVQLFFTQLLTLNNLLCANHCGGSVVPFEQENLFNGFNFEIYEVLPEELCGNVEGGEIQGCYYWCQSKYEFLSELLMRNEDMDVSELIFLFVEVSVGKHCLKVDESVSVLRMLSKEFEFFCNRNDMSLRILKSSCRLVWLLYEFVVFWDMLDHIVVYEPFLWNAQLLLENNGLQSQFGDHRSQHYSEVPMESSGGMDMVDEDCGGAKIWNDTVVEDESVGSEEDEDVIGEGCVDSGVGDGNNEEQLSLNGGINHILQNVDWVKESADEVFEKIHKVLK